ncbi:hypothetical protein SUGI_0692010 [Cryptomeria japonica]|nr:hypothetical protein SUGI_0692010 [Cryptomeria japonica]
MSSSRRGRDSAMQDVRVVVLLVLGFAIFAHCHFVESRRKVSNEEAKYSSHRQLLYYTDGSGERGEKVEVDPSLKFPNSRLENAYIALQAWKEAIISDPFNTTGNWFGADVCNYTGVFCSPALDNPNITVVAGIDLNHADIAGYLPVELGLLTDLAFFHINSNRICGIVPHTFVNMTELFEFDISNNRFAGPFPLVVLSMPKLQYLDIRFNEFEGSLPEELFDKDLDAIFINDNRFHLEIPSNLGNSPVSVLVFANNNLKGCLPPSLTQMDSLNELIFMNNNLSACLPSTIGNLRNLTVFDISFNKLVGSIPDSIGEMVSLEQLNIAHNKLSGRIPESICALPNLENFTFTYNIFNGEAPNCLALPSKGVTFNDANNCIPGRPSQRSFMQCAAVLSQPMGCNASNSCVKVSCLLP